MDDVFESQKADDHEADHCAHIEFAHALFVCKFAVFVHALYSNQIEGICKKVITSLLLFLVFSL